MQPSLQQPVSLKTRMTSGEAIPFSPPYIDEEVIEEVIDTLRSGWITTGHKVRKLEEACAHLSSCEACVCVNSWTSGAQLALKWWGVGPGDEVIVPAYTYAATALAVIHAGANPVMVDVLDDFTIDPEKVRQAITPRTKAIIPVDFGGWPCNYKAIRQVIEGDEIKKMFIPVNENQQRLGRILIVSDAAHSIGAQYNTAPAAAQADITIYSFHAVKNITTAEGGAVCLNLPAPLENKVIWAWMKLNSMNGQTKDAFSKTQAGGWRYDIVSLGLKINMPDIAAAIGLPQIRQYDSHLLPERKRVFQLYDSIFSGFGWAQLPQSIDGNRVSAYHLYPIRIKGITEQQRDAMIDIISSFNIAVNVHFIPLPLLTVFKNMGYEIQKYPSSYHQYSRVITLPIYPQLGNEQVHRIAESVILAYSEILHAK